VFYLHLYSADVSAYQEDAHRKFKAPLVYVAQTMFPGIPRTRTPPKRGPSPHFTYVQRTPRVVSPLTLQHLADQKLVLEVGEHIVTAPLPTITLA
jgi:hypothetical protein